MVNWKKETIIKMKVVENNEVVYITEIVAEETYRTDVEELIIKRMPLPARRASTIDNPLCYEVGLWFI